GGLLLGGLGRPTGSANGPGRRSRRLLGFDIFDRRRGPTEGAVSSVTGPQRTRLVLALGGLNIVLATVAFGLAGSLTPTDQSARASATPSLSVPPIAGASPSPSVEPAASQPPGTVPTQDPGVSPQASGAVESSAPGSTAG